MVSKSIYLVFGLLSFLFLSSFFFFGSFCSPFNTLQDIGHGSRSVRSEDFDSNNLCLLGDTICLGSDCTGDVSSVSITVFIFIASRNGSSPMSTTLKFLVMDIDTSVNNIG